MSDVNQGEHNFFQFDPSQIGSDWLGSGAQHRPMSMKLSNYGSLNYGNRNSDDYTKTTFEFKAKSDFENPRIPSFIQEAERDNNPFVEGSTVKRTRNDEFIVMGLGSRRTSEPTEPRFDVSDTNLIRSGMQAGKNYPSEGWRSFGGKYDFPVAYQG